MLGSYDARLALPAERSGALLRTALDLDLIGDADHPGHTSRGVFGGGALSAEAHGASQEDVALLAGRPECRHLHLQHPPRWDGNRSRDGYRW